MKKYKVITDNLDWVGLEKGKEIEFGDDAFCITYTTDAGERHRVLTPKVLDDKGYLQAFKMHPEWFKEIKEDPKEFSRDQMIDCVEVVMRTIADLRVNGVYPHEIIRMVDRWIDTHSK